MNLHSFFILFSIGQFFTLNYAVAQDSDWELKKDKDGIKVFTRPVEDSALDEFKSEGIVDAGVDQIVAILKDVDQMKAWVPDCKVAELMKFEGDDQYHYVETQVPFPIRNRDSYVRYRYTKTENGIKVSMEAIPEYKPEVDGLVRIPYLDGFWLLEEISKGRTKVTYQVHDDPGGTIPAWLANATAVNNPYHTIKNLRKILD
jgi:hypothetical protein